MTVTAFRNRREPRFFSTREDQPSPDMNGGPDEAPPEPPASSLFTSVATAAAPAARRARTGAGAWLRRSGARVRQFVLSASGLGAFAVGGFEAHPVAGWIVTGLALLVLEHQVKS